MRLYLPLLLALAGPLAAAADNPPVEELIRQLETGTAPQQVSAADQLAKRGEAARPAVPALLKTIAGQSTWVDLAMSEALAELAPVSLPFLMERLKSDDPATRLLGLRGMMRMGARAKEARALVQPLRDDKDEMTRRMATRILDGMDIEPPAGPAFQERPTAPVTGAIRATPAAGGTVRDWPGFRGPNRDGLCTETGLLQEWPAAGPNLLWRIETAGKGLSAPAIAKGRIYLTGDREVNGEQGQYVLAFDLASRAELWATRVGKAYRDYGALSTPTVDDDALYVTTTDGGVVCLNTKDGKVQWQKSMIEDFGGAMMSIWRWSESPLVDGEKVVVTPGGAKAMIVALKKRTGETIWKCEAPPLGERGKDGAGYCSVAIAEADGVRQYIQLVGRGLIGVAADSGKFLWGYNRLASTTANIPSPIIRGREVLLVNGYNTGAALLRLKAQDGAARAEEVYVLPATTLQNHHGGVVLVGDYVYGGSGSNKGDPTCIEFATGRVMWKVKAPVSGSACVLYADGHILFRYDRGLVQWVEANPAAYKVKGSYTPPRSDRAAWCYPVIHDRKLYLRDQQLLLCYELRAE